jgi:hypothetical protein
MEAIKDGKGSGRLAEVDKNQQLRVRSESEPIQHTQALKGNSYQVIGEAELQAGVTVGLCIKNESTNKNLVVTYIRHQIIDPAGGTSFPNRQNYYRLVLGRTYVSGGSIQIPINLNTSSGLISQTIAYDNNPVLTGTAKILDKWYTKSEGDMSAFNKEGSIIISPNNSLELSYVGDQTSGLLYTRLSFIMKDQD